MDFSKIYEEIEKILKESKTELSINEIAEKIGKSRNTTSKYLAYLEGKKTVSVRELGRNKMYKIKDSYERR